jgi:hypothetical protein
MVIGYVLFVICYLLTASPALPGNRCPEALPRIACRKIGGRADRSAFPGRAGERVENKFLSVSN